LPAREIAVDALAVETHAGRHAGDDDGELRPVRLAGGGEGESHDAACAMVRVRRATSTLPTISSSTLMSCAMVNGPRKRSSVAVRKSMRCRRRYSAHATEPPISPPYQTSPARVKRRCQSLKRIA